MELKKAIERLKKEKEQLIDAIECSLSGTSERNDWGGLVQAIDTVLAELKESKKEGKWKPKDGEKFWFRNFRGKSESYIHEDFFNTDEWIINNLPIFKTKEECEKYWHFMDTVKEKSYEFSKEEWEDDDVEKFSIGYIPVINDFAVTYDDCKYLGKIYFKTHEDAQYIIDNFKEELLKYWL